MFNFYLKLYFKNNVGFNIKMRIFLKHLRLIVSFLFNKNNVEQKTILEKITQH